MRDIRERLDDICAAQRGAGVDYGVPKVMCFLLGAFFLDDMDLEQLHPHLRQEPDLPDTGQVGWYRGVGVYPPSAKSMEELPVAEYQGVLYAYCEMDHVD